MNNVKTEDTTATAAPPCGLDPKVGPPPGFRFTPHGAPRLIRLPSGFVIPPHRNQSVTLMKSSTRNRAEGATKSLVGKVKTATGKLVGNPRLEARGRSEQAVGLAQKKAGQIQRGMER